MKTGSLIIPLELNHTDASLFRAETNVPPQYFTAGIIQPGWTVNTGAGFKFYVTGTALDQGAYMQAIAIIGLGRKFASNELLGLFQQKFHVGYTWVAQCGLVVDIYGGLEHSFFIVNDQSLGFLQWAGIKLGYAF